MKRIFTLLLFCLMIVISNGCSNDDDNSNCGPAAQIVADQPFGEIATDNYIISAVTLDENCLHVTISSSGCDGSQWETDLFNNEQQLKLELTNPELCLAVVSKTVSFNLKPLRVNGQNQVTLMLQGWATPIVYNY